jgi:AraC family transcriptional regulator, regulatory protein of adaptative response / methylated-DNA-[protein]-cysteine methyltransferase
MKTFYGYAQTPFGTIIMFGGNEGISKLDFVGIHLSSADNIALSKDVRDDKVAQQYIDCFLERKALPDIDLQQGTPFQKSVWKALLTIPFGETVSYQDVAGMIHNTKAVRAVANAVGKNPISIIIPCHRVIHNNGSIGGYGWGVELKKKILEWEQGKLNNK